MYKAITTTLFLSLSTTATATSLFGTGGSTTLLNVQEFSIEHLQYEALRDPYFPDHGQRDWVNRVNVNFKLGLFRYFYYDSEIFLAMDRSPQVRSAGLEYRAGLKVLPWLDLVKYHMSRHTLEEARPYRFPVADAFGFKIYFIK